MGVGRSPVVGSGAAVAVRRCRRHRPLPARQPLVPPSPGPTHRPHAFSAVMSLNWVQVTAKPLAPVPLPGACDQPRTDRLHLAPSELQPSAPPWLADNPSLHPAPRADEKMVYLLESAEVVLDVPPTLDGPKVRSSSSPAAAREPARRLTLSRSPLASGPSRRRARSGSRPSGSSLPRPRPSLPLRPTLLLQRTRRRQRMPARPAPTLGLQTRSSAMRRPSASLSAVACRFLSRRHRADASVLAAARARCQPLVLFASVRTLLAPAPPLALPPPLVPLPAGLRPASLRRQPHPALVRALARRRPAERVGRAGRMPGVPRRGQGVGGVRAAAAREGARDGAGREGARGRSTS